MAPRCASKRHGIPMMRRALRCSSRGVMGGAPVAGPASSRSRRSSGPELSAAPRDACDAALVPSALAARSQPVCEVLARLQPRVRGEDPEAPTGSSRDAMARETARGALDDYDEQTPPGAMSTLLLSSSSSCQSWLRRPTMSKSARMPRALSRQRSVAGARAPGESASHLERREVELCKTRKAERRSRSPSLVASTVPTAICCMT